MSARLAALAAAGALGLGALAGCGGGDAPARPTAAHAPSTFHHHVAPDANTVRAADCHYWHGASYPDRVVVLRHLRTFFGARVDSGNGPGEYGPTLTDAQAIAIIDAECRPRYATAFKLYKIYGRAAAFSG